MADGWTVTTRASAADPSPAAAAGWTVAKRGNLSNARPVVGDVPDNRIRDGVTGPLTSIYQGATLDFGDEALGALAGGAGYLFSGGDSAEAKRAYESGRDVIRETQQSYAQDNPVLSTVYQLGGGLVPVIASGGYALGAAAPTLGARVAGAAATGAAYGGVAGFGAGEGSFENRVGSAAAGAAGGAVFGAGAELGATAVGRIYNSLRSRFGPQARLVDENGRPTAQAKQAAQEAGLDINQVPLPALEAVERRGGAAAAEGTPEMLRAQSLPVPVDLTTGQATGNRSLLEREYGIWRNAEGTPAAAEMRDFVDRQQTQLAANIPALQQRVGGVGIERGQGGAMAANRLVEMEAGAKRQANDLYRRARDLEQEAAPSGVPFAPLDEEAAGRASPYAETEIPRAEADLEFLRAGQERRQAGAVRTIQAMGGIKLMRDPSTGRLTSESQALRDHFDGKYPPGLINKNGRPLDYVREALDEQGWFPAGDGGDIQQVLDLIGTKARNPNDAIRRSASEENYRARVGGEVSELGINLRRRPNDAETLRLAESRAVEPTDERVPDTLRAGSDAAGADDLADMGFIEESVPDGGPTAAQGFAGEQGGRLLGDVYSRLRENGHYLRTLPKVGAAMRALTRDFNDAEGQLPVGRVFQALKELANVQRSGGEEAVAAGTAKRLLEQGLDDGLESGLLAGDQGVIDAYKAARANYREYATRFKADDLVGALVERDTKNAGPNGSFRLKVDPAEATNYIFGTSEAGLTSKRDLTRDLVKVRDMLGPDSQEWRAVKEEAFLRIARKSFGQTLPNAGAGNGRAFSGANLFKAWDKFTSDNPQLAAVIFTPEQRRDIGNWVQVARETTVRDPASFAPSTSPLQMRNTMRRLFNRTALARIPGLNLLSEALLQSLENAAGVRGARGATQGPLPARPRPAPRGAPAGLVPAAGQFGGNLLSGP